MCFIYLQLWNYNQKTPALLWQQNRCIWLCSLPNIYFVTSRSHQISSFLSFGLHDNTRKSLVLLAFLNLPRTLTKDSEKLSYNPIAEHKWYNTLNWTLCQHFEGKKFVLKVIFGYFLPSYKKPRQGSPGPGAFVLPCCQRLIPGVYHPV